MAEKQKTILKFEVKSLNPNRKTIEYLEFAEALSDDIEKAIGQEYPGVKLTIKREEGLPIAPLVQHLIVNVDWHAVKSGAEQAAAAFATTQILIVLKQKLQDLSAKPIKPISGAGNETTTKKPAKSSSKKKINATQAKGKVKR